jgi:hypothetical protein
MSLALGLSACEKIKPAPEWKAVAPPKAIAMSDAIPLEYGDLIGVVPGEAPGWARLYFQRADKSIVVVVVNGDAGYIGDRVVDFPRR